MSDLRVPQTGWLQRRKIAAHLVPVPKDGDGVCPVCRSWKHARFPYCSNCMESKWQLPYFCTKVVPMTMYAKPSDLRDWLTYYKEPAHPRQPDCVSALKALCSAFLRMNLADVRDCFGEEWDIATVVPSSSPRSYHPLSDIFRSNDLGSPIIPLLKSTSVSISHREANVDAFSVRAEATPQRVLILDDVYTTGARAQSAAARLILEGFSVVGLLVIARRINPDFNEASRTLWRRQSRKRYSFKHALCWCRSPHQYDSTLQEWSQ